MNMFLTTLASLAALTAPPVHAQVPPPLPLLALAEHLDLSATQRDQIQQLLQGRKAALATKRNAAQQAHRRLQTAVGDPGVTPAQLRSLCDQEAQARQAELLEVHGAALGALALLTPEQQKQYRHALTEVPLIRSVVEGMGGGRAHGWPGGPAPEQGPREGGAPRHPGAGGLEVPPPPRPE